MGGERDDEITAGKKSGFLGMKTTRSYTLGPVAALTIILGISAGCWAGIFMLGWKVGSNFVCGR